MPKRSKLSKWDAPRVLKEAAALYIARRPKRAFQLLRSIERVVPRLPKGFRHLDRKVQAAVIRSS